MRIDSAVRPPYLVNISGAAQARPVAPPAAKRGASPDRVEISQQSKELDRLKKALEALPEVRTDRVALARQQMQYGPYRVDPVLVAQRMIKEQPLQGDDL